MDRPVIEKGERVLLTLLTEEDVDWLWKNINNRQIIKWLASYGTFSKEEELKFIQNSYSKEEPSFLIVTHTGERVGVCGVNEFDQRNLRMEVGIWVSEAYQGKGYGTEALRLLTNYLFREYPINKLYAYVSTNNIPSIRMLEKVGFKREGKLREHVWKSDGRFGDVYIYGLLRREWKRLQKK